MKCIHCGQDSNRKDRQASGACPRCQRRFAFEPTTDAQKITDTFFKHTLDAVSSQGTLSFTDRQVWYEFVRRLARRRWWTGPLTLGFGSFIFGAACLWNVLGAWALAGPAVLTLAVGAAAYVNHREKLRHPALDFETFNANYLAVWKQVQGPLEKLIPTVNPRFATALGPEPDLTAYSFDRVLVTDHFPIAAMLVANNFHFEHNCAILSVDGFPAGRRDTILTMLQRNPALTVYALHDASGDGCRLPLTLRQRDWFPDPATTVVDLGLRPRHVTEKGWMTITGFPQTLPEEIHSALTPPEVTWLATGQVGELALLRPELLMRAVYRGMGRAAEAINKNKTAEDSSASGGDGGDGGGVIWIHSPGHTDDDQLPATETPDFAPAEFDDGDPGGGDFGADSFG